MKAIPRSGWISHGIVLQDVESVADHSYSTCALALLLADLELKRGRNVDVERVLRMALIHDLPESLTFDISKEYLKYLGKRGDAMKRELDRSAWKHITNGLRDPTLQRTYTGLQKEFEEERTFESQMVRAADRLDILLQIIAYRRRGYDNFMLEDIWSETNKKLRSSRIASARNLRITLLREAKELAARKVR